MRVHFISVLGTSLYEPVVYRFQGEKEGGKEQEFVQIAMLEKFQNQIAEDGKISIFLTDGAKKRNWENRIYNVKDVEFSERWTSKRKLEICGGNEKPGMESILKKDYPELWERTEGIRISNASTEEEIWSVFETIFNMIEENDEIIFDITHSFRSIPMLAITIINYAKVLKNCTLKGIYYGAYEAAETAENVKYAPVVDLTVYNEILEWTNAAEAFMQYGFASKMKEVYDKKMGEIPNDKKKEWGAIGSKIAAMQNLSLAIFTCRGTDASKLESGNKRAFAKSVKNAYQNLAEKSDKVSQDKDREIKPLYPLVEKIEERYKEYFSDDSNFEIGCGVVRWSIQNSMVQQGYTALEETMITYLCAQYGLDDRTEKTREDIVGRTITGIAKYIEKKQSATYFEEHREEAAEDIFCMRLEQRKGEEEQKEKMKEIVRTLPVPFVILCKKVKNRRNDINHFGFRTNPLPADTLNKELNQLYDEFIEYVGKYPLSRKGDA